MLGHVRPESWVTLGRNTQLARARTAPVRPPGTFSTAFGSAPPTKSLRGFLAALLFHDARHEAVSPLANKLSIVLPLSPVTRHRGLRILKRYYHPRAEDLAKNPN
jgi:hypothetical protein